jgi:glucokinase
MPMLVTFINKKENVRMIKQKIIAGVDIGGTNTAFGLVDFDNNVISQNSFKTRPEKGADLFLEHLAEAINSECLKLKDEYVLSGIGVAAPSANYINGTIESPANLKWGNINLIEMMKKYFDIPVTIINDANAAALGEYTFGTARGMKNFIVLTLGTGLGSGIFIDGRLLYGEDGHAGEIGHTAVEAMGRQCSCGRYDCLETYVSASGLKRSVFQFLSCSNEESELRDINFNDLTGKKISELAYKNDPIALKAFDYTGEIFGRALANVVNIFNPEAVILFGGLVDADELLLEPTNRYFEKYLLKIHRGRTRILKSQLQNRNAAVLGAYSFVKDLLGSNNIKKEEVNNISV